MTIAQACAGGAGTAACPQRGHGEAPRRIWYTLAGVVLWAAGIVLSPFIVPLFVLWPAAAVVMLRGQYRGEEWYPSTWAGSLCWWFGWLASALAFLAVFCPIALVLIGMVAALL